uniref:Uncharacterized protein n=1 Tax=Candidatus Kentrum sp. TC TaxID=2126339 RepID=A0A451A2Q1_9GAMM|nr:MAG: hypothetical protein BECKTC1821D_GA0114238_10547 [Candidatus Kentron sp. TC]VFK60297.1 MAG: hypothetical protein BECKTC1821F_GA0114240_10449 [Candidatus Kentron sp. TC]
MRENFRRQYWDTLARLSVLEGWGKPVPMGMKILSSFYDVNVYFPIECAKPIVIGASRAVFHADCFRMNRYRYFDRKGEIFRGAKRTGFSVPIEKTSSSRKSRNRQL